MIAIAEAIQKEYGWKEGLTIFDGIIKEWPYSAPLPSPAEVACLVEKWEPIVQWERQMRESDVVMPRWFEDHITGSHGGIAGDTHLQQKYDAKLAIRTKKPIVGGVQ
ncbi:MAG: hypothetical protein HQL90_04310 [Magnetococcales bacterium]|nr:hypothetical protein [Magnetococcales bacterium]